VKVSDYTDFETGSDLAQAKLPVWNQVAESCPPLPCTPCTTESTNPLCVAFTSATLQTAVDFYTKDISSKIGIISYYGPIECW
jgi:hypothetical protein